MSCDNDGLLDGFLVANKFEVILPHMIVDLANNIQQVNIPDFSIGTTEVSTPQGARLKLPGDNVEYSGLNITFILDENLVVYDMLVKWMKACSYPEDPKQFSAFANYYKGNYKDPEDALMQPLVVISKSGSTKDLTWTFNYAFPTSISSITFDTTLTDATVSTVDVAFDYTFFDIGLAGKSSGIVIP